MNEVQLRHRLASFGFAALVLVLLLSGVALGLAATGKLVAATFTGVTAFLIAVVTPFFAMLPKLAYPPASTSEMNR